MSAKELASYLGLNEKKIYQLAREGSIPAARIGGKWVFPKHLIDEWIEKDALSRLRFKSSMETLVIMGSNDPAWDILSKKLIDFPYGIILALSSVGSTKGLMALSQGLCDAASSHLLDPETLEYNIPYLSRFLKGEDVVVITLFHREQGLMVKKGNPKGIERLEDLTRSDVTFINRQEGSGTRVLFDLELSAHGIDPSRIKGYENTASTHMEVALKILTGEADTGLGIRSVANMVGLEFILPLKDERYDLVVLKNSMNLKKIRILLDVLESKDVRETLSKMGGYNLSDMGKVVWEGRV